MSEYTREEILKLIEENGGPERLDLSGKDLNRIDLSTETIQAELRRLREVDPESMPKWWWGRPDHEGIALMFTNFRGANLEGARLQRANLKGANLQGANLSHVRLQEAYMALANLQGANLSWAYLQVNSLWKSELQGANLEHADLRRVDLRYVKSLRGAFFYGVRLDHTDMDRNSLGPAVGEELAGKYSRARDAYLRLKRNFDDLGDYAASAWAYRKERQMEKACSAPWRARRFYGESQLGDTEESKLPAWHPKVLLFYTRHTGKYLADWLVELVCCYGEGVSNVLASMVVLLLGFTVIYWVMGGVGSDPASPSANFWDYLKYSWGVFIGKDFETARALSDRIELASTVQTFLRNILTGLLGFVLGNRIRRS